MALKKDLLLTRAFNSNGSGHDEATSRILSTHPHIDVTGNLTEMSPEVVAARCGPDLSCVKYLNLHSNHIRKIENLGQLVQLETLILSFNEIAKIENVEVLTALQVRSRVEISMNKMRKWQLTFTQQICRRWICPSTW